MGLGGGTVKKKRVEYKNIQEESLKKKKVEWKEMARDVGEVTKKGQKRPLGLKLGQWPI